MTTDDNITLVRRYIDDAFNGHNPDGLDAILAEVAVNHAAPHLPGREGFKQILATLFKAFPDAYWTIEDIFAFGDKVATRGRWGGTHRGDFFGTPPMGRRFEVTHMHISAWQMGGLPSIGPIAMTSATGNNLASSRHGEKKGRNKVGSGYSPWSWRTWLYGLP